MHGEIGATRFDDGAGGSGLVGDVGSGAKASVETVVEAGTGAGGGVDTGTGTCIGTGPGPGSGSVVTGTYRNTVGEYLSKLKGRNNTASG